MSTTINRTARRSQRLIIQSLLSGKLLSKAELSRKTGLSSPAIGKAANELIQTGYLQEHAPTESPTTERAVEGDETGPGRPSRPLGLDASKKRYIAVQLGVHRTRIAALSLAGPTNHHDDWPINIPTPTGADHWADALRAAASELPTTQPELVIVGTPGVIDVEHGRILYSPNLHWSEGDRVKQITQSIWNAPVHLIQEIRALALGHRENVAGDRDFLLVDFGVGVAASMIRGCELYTGPVALSGELGHTPVHANDRKCGCGAIGCIETLISRQGLLKSFRDHDNPHATWALLHQHIEQNGLPTWLKDTLEAAANVIAGAMNMTGQTTVIVTGSLTELPNMVMQHFEHSIRRGAMWARFGHVRVKAAPRRRAAGLVIAAIEHTLLKERTL